MLWIDDISDEDQTILEAHGLVFNGGEVTLPDTVIATDGESAMGWSIESYEVDGIRFELVSEEMSDRSELRIVGKRKANV